MGRAVMSPRGERLHRPAHATQGNGRSERRPRPGAHWVGREVWFCSRVWARRPLCQWVLQACTSQWVLHPCVCQRALASCARRVHVWGYCSPSLVNGYCIPVQDSRCLIPASPTGSSFLHKLMGIVLLHKSMGAAFLHKSMGATSLHKSMWAASLHKSMGAAARHKSLGVDLCRAAALIHLYRDAAPIHLYRAAAPIHLYRDAAPIHLYRDAAPIDSHRVASLHKSMDCIPAQAFGVAQVNRCCITDHACVYRTGSTLHRIPMRCKPSHEALYGDSELDAPSVTRPEPRSPRAIHTDRTRRLELPDRDRSHEAGGIIHSEKYS